MSVATGESNNGEKDLAALRDLDQRDVDALMSDTMAVLDTDAAGDDVAPIAGRPDFYLCVSSSADASGIESNEYVIDLRGESCTCPDARHRDVRCKHVRRAKFATGQKEIPPGVDDAAVADNLGAHL
jgi:hypothetical protein